LADLLGRPMIEHVWRRCLAVPGLDVICAATDSPEIFKAVEAFGGRALMTSARHASGTDRLAEAADLLGLADDDVVVNVQGDQPALDPLHPAQMVQALLDDPTLAAATVAVPFADPEEAADPNHVKAVFGRDGRALYFSRAPIPWPRDGQTITRYKHVGLYAYRAGFLRRFTTWPPGRLEEIEKLEQLRILEMGEAIQVVVVKGLSPEVDVPADLAKAAVALTARGLA
jgi:3-deoxy-manno-octulosonate cytidylyltransferase (CMP-KDO synthetase)